MAFFLRYKSSPDIQRQRLKWSTGWLDNNVSRWCYDYFLIKSLTNASNNWTIFYRRFWYVTSESMKSKFQGQARKLKAKSQKSRTPQKINAMVLSLIQCFIKILDWSSGQKELRKLNDWIIRWPGVMLWSLLNYIVNKC